MNAFYLFLGICFVFWALETENRRIRAWIVETYAQAHIEAEKRRMALYEAQTACCDDCEDST